MTYGIRITNDSSHILLDSELSSFHYAGTARYVRTSLTGMTEFEGFEYGTPGDLNGRFVHLFEITLRDGVDIMAFIQPGNQTESYGVLRKYIKGTGIDFKPPDPYDDGGGGGGTPIDPDPPGDDDVIFLPETVGAQTTWVIEVLQRGTISRPPRNVLCFVQLLGVRDPINNHGMITRDEDGFITFDSGRMPLALVTTKSVIPPEVPLNSGTPHQDISIEWGDSFDSTGRKINGPLWDTQGETARLSYERETFPGSDVMETIYISFRCEEAETLFDLDSGLSRDNIAFTAPALAQSCMSYEYYTEKESRNFFGSTQFHYSTSLWFCLYHQTYRLDGTLNPRIAAGWSPFYGGYFYDADWSGGGPGGGSGGSTIFGVEPYEDKTINYQPNIMMVINAEDYLGQEIDTGAVSGDST